MRELGDGGIDVGEREARGRRTSRAPPARSPRCDSCRAPMCFARPWSPRKAPGGPRRSRPRRSRSRPCWPRAPRAARVTTNGGCRPGLTSSPGRSPSNNVGVEVDLRSCRSSFRLNQRPLWMQTGDLNRNFVGIRSLAVRKSSRSRASAEHAGALVPDGGGTRRAAAGGHAAGDARGAHRRLRGRARRDRSASRTPGVGGPAPRRHTQPGRGICVMATGRGSRRVTPPYAYLKYAGAASAAAMRFRLPAESSLWFAPALAVVVRGQVRDIAPEDWRDAVFGFTGFVDVVRPGNTSSPAGRLAGGGGHAVRGRSCDRHRRQGPAGLGLTVGTVTATDPGRPPVPTSSRSCRAS